MSLAKLGWRERRFNNKKVRNDHYVDKFLIDSAGENFSRGQWVICKKKKKKKKQLFDIRHVQGKGQMRNHLIKSEPSKYADMSKKPRFASRVQ